MIAMMQRSRLLAWLLMVMLSAPAPVGAQQPAAPPAASAAFTPEQLEQLAAPIALYPDPILAQVMMASTYPLEVVQAARFVKDNPNLKGDQLDEKLKEQTWDDSVKSLVSFPQVLSLMDGKLDWTQKLGDAVLDQQKELMDAVQRLRALAQKEGNLKSTAEQTVTVEPAAAAPPAPGQPPPSQTVVVQQQPAQVITIEPASPQVVYVPSYNPTVVYGAWPYPAYPPYYPYPPGYAFGAAALSFGVGMAVGAAVWGNCNWGGGNVDVNVNQNANFSRNVNRTDVASQRTQRAQQGQAGNRSQWQHNPENRRGVQYRDQVDPAAVQPREQSAGHPVPRGLPRAGRSGPPGSRPGRCRPARWRAKAGRRSGGARAQGRPKARPHRTSGGLDRPEGVKQARSRGWVAAAPTPGTPAIGARAVARASGRAAEAAVLGRPRRGPVAAGVAAAVAAVGGRRRWRWRTRRRRSPVMRAVPEGSMMRQSRTRWRGGRWLRLIGIVLVTVGLAAEWGSSAFAAVTQRRFASVDAAAQALVDAFRSGEGKAMLAVLGDEGNRVVSSGDPVSDRRARERFVAAYDDKHRLEAGGGKVVLVVGRNDFPFPIPIVPDGPSWRFDTAAGNGGDRQPAHRAERAQHDPGLPRLRRRPARVLRARSRRRRTAAVRAEVRQQLREGGTGSTGRRSRVSRPARSGRSSPGRGTRGTRGPRRSPSPTGATTTGS